MTTTGKRSPRVPGIVEAAGPPERMARIEGTGIEVFVVFKTYHAVGQSWDDLREAFHWLNEEQLRAALAYADAHRQAMEERLAEEDRAPDRLEQLWRQYPALAPKRR
jgi:uncharacterized protein (DUF433 family)